MILLIDNYDSFTYNLVQQMRADGAVVEVIRNDVEDVETLLRRKPAGIVLSPGPGRPEDAGVCLDLLAARPDVPILGVCLGHQSLGVSEGATVERAARLMHGKTSMVCYGEDPLFVGLPNPFQATRYHSLAVVGDSVPDALEAIAWTTEVGSSDAVGVETIMALRHRSKPYWGVQFHPESILTPEGPQLLRNFLALCGVKTGGVMTGRVATGGVKTTDRRSA